MDWRANGIETAEKSNGETKRLTRREKKSRRGTHSGGTPTTAKGHSITDAVLAILESEEGKREISSPQKGMIKRDLRRDCRHPRNKEKMAE